ncbi:BaiN/RdsA family NAD(P)/FAD-dependent oxidoreductase [Actibacterium pelagium]|uniref:Oxidoreductase n=1 Tax=Actibacterium pelagium TaxID=2029103 RepID=A0A917AC88_9RHOB|nr:NAD(P)/FAD-dependent oxidoreductase [Actibacterium pelagium]GGE40886.1 oxidoreductase [Actibacterium pelagium]
MPHHPTIIIGAGAAGLMCAAHAGPGTLVIDHAKAAGEKIRISGGGRCNFTNMYAGPENFISGNPHFAKSALARYTQWDFIDLVARHGIPYHEKTLGQLFCDTSAKDIIAMLLDEMAKAGATLRLQTSVTEVYHDGNQYHLTLSEGAPLTCDQLVIASGGKSIPKMGATGFGYQIASQFGLPVTETRPGLVPLTFGDTFKAYSGVSLPARVTANGPGFDEALLFTHRGLSGPAILQASSYWHEGEDISINLLPNQDVFQTLRDLRARAGAKNASTMLAEVLPSRLAPYFAEQWGLTGNLADYSDVRLRELAEQFQNWTVRPTGSEGYRTAEVTLGGVDTDALNARTMEAKAQPGLYFIGEVVDVTGWLGGFNFQWAWSSGWAAGTAIAELTKPK